MVKLLIDRMKPVRTEDEKVAEIKKATKLLAETIKRLGD
jgi:hypothetical protein